jgi:hypothetical protein
MEEVIIRFKNLSLILDCESQVAVLVGKGPDPKHKAITLTFEELEGVLKKVQEERQ